MTCATPTLTHTLCDKGCKHKAPHLNDTHTSHWVLFALDCNICLMQAIYVEGGCEEWLVLVDPASPGKGVWCHVTCVTAVTMVGTDVLYWQPPCTGVPTHPHFILPTSCTVCLFLGSWKLCAIFMIFPFWLKYFCKKYTWTNFEQVYSEIILILSEKCSFCRLWIVGLYLYICVQWCQHPAVGQLERVKPLVHDLLSLPSIHAILINSTPASQPASQPACLPACQWY